MIRLKRRTSLPSFVLAFLLAYAVIPGAAAKKPQHSAVLPGATGGQYAETDICQTCHQEVWDKHFANTPHAALLKGNQHGCQACHGPAQAHVDGGGDPTKIVRFEKLSSAETAAICTKCHQSTPETQNFSKSEHLANGVSCTRSEERGVGKECRSRW